MKQTNEKKSSKKIFFWLLLLSIYCVQISKQCDNTEDIKNK